MLKQYGVAVAGAVLAVQAIAANAPIFSDAASQYDPRHGLGIVCERAAIDRIAQPRTPEDDSVGRGTGALTAVTLVARHDSVSRRA